jgi:hypothetical protein
MLADPFDPRCYGVRVPDSYSLPTITYHVRTTYTITSNASGVVELAFMPNPMLCLIAGQGSVSGVTPYAANTAVGSISSPATLLPQLLSYRVVGWGAKLLAKDTAFAEKGRLYSVVIPNTGTQPSTGTLQNVSATNVQTVSEYLIGYQLGTATPAVLQNYATCQSFSLQDLLAYGSMVNSISPCHADQFRFRGVVDPSAVQWNATTEAYQEGTFVIATGVSSSGGSLDPTNLSGTNTLIIYASGMPVNSNEFDIDIIMHIEGTPNLNANTSPFIPSGMDAAPGSTTTLESVLARSKPYTDAFRTGARMAMNNIGTTAVQFGANLAVRAAMAHGRGRGNRYISGPSGPG